MGGDRRVRHRFKELLSALKQELRSDYGLTVIASRALVRRLAEFIEQLATDEEELRGAGQVRVVAVAEGIPFHALTEMSVDKLYALKGEIVARGVRAVTGCDLPVFPKRRFQHGALPVERLRHAMPDQEAHYRKQFLALYN